MRRAWLLALVLLCAAAPAFAHALLQRAVPGAGAVLAVSPPELSLTFSEGVEPLFSTIELQDANGAPIAIGKPASASGNKRQLVVTLPKLAPGTYSVIWRATSVDTHKTEGSYKFTVGP